MDALFQEKALWPWSIIVFAGDGFAKLRKQGSHIVFFISFSMFAQTTKQFSAAQASKQLQVYARIQGHILESLNNLD